MSVPAVTPEKKRKLREKMAAIGVSEQDLVEKFIRGSGSGGQKINKTSSCVYLRHEPTGIEIKCQKTRSQSLNRYHARKLLCDRLEEIKLGKESAKQQEAERIRRQKRRRSRKQKAKMLEEKRQTGEQKELRKRVDPED